MDTCVLADFLNIAPETIVFRGAVLKSKRCLVPESNPEKTGDAASFIDVYVV